VPDALVLARSRCEPVLSAPAFWDVGRPSVAQSARCFRGDGKGSHRADWPSGDLNQSRNSRPSAWFPRVPGSAIVREA